MTAMLHQAHPREMDSRTERLLIAMGDPLYVPQITARVQPDSILSLLLADRPLTDAEWARINAAETLAEGL